MKRTEHFSNKHGLGLDVDVCMFTGHPEQLVS